MPELTPTDFTSETISRSIKGKRVSSFGFLEGGMNNAFYIEFDDNTKFVIEYDWIYEWRIVRGGET